MAYSKIQIASNALILLGDEPISAFDGNGSGAVAAENLYDTSYSAILTSFRWNFATKKKQLSRLTESPQNEYKYQFQLPSDLLLMITTYPASTYRILGNKLYSNSQKVEIDYIYKIDEANFPHYFVKAFEYYLAMQLAIPVTEDLNKAQLMEQMYNKEVRKARYADGQSAPNAPIQDTPNIFVRNL